MRVQSSHLSLRFYKHDGWTKKVLNSCLESGGIEFCDGPGLNYFRSTIYSSFDVDKLMSHVTEVIRWSDVLDKSGTDKEYLQSMNW